MTSELGSTGRSETPPVSTLPIADPQATLGTVSGKGTSLARLSASGLPVPDGFRVATAAYHRFVTVHGLQEPILAAVSSAAADRPETLEEASRQIGKLFAQAEMPKDIAEAIGHPYARLGSDIAVAVRSSATAEDLPETSLVGQQETYLNVRGQALVLDAVKRCWLHCGPRAIGYRASNDIASSHVSAAVVEQRLVSADAAGVTDVGAPLSHAAILAHELGIPAVVGCGDATMRLHTGDLVRVDGG